MSVYDEFMEANTKLNDAGAPLIGRKAYMRREIYEELNRLAGTDNPLKTLDGVKLKVVLDQVLPKDTNLLIKAGL